MVPYRCHGHHDDHAVWRGIPFADWVKAADLIDLSGKDGAHKVTVVATTETGLGNYYTGEAIEAPVTVKVDGEEVPSDCYDVVYTNNVNVSTATELAVATITGKPEKGYTGSNTAKFKIRVTPINKAKVKFASDMTLVSGKYCKESGKFSDSRIGYLEWKGSGSGERLL